MTKVYDAQEIRGKLATSDKWLIRGILAIYARQTADEQSSQTTKYHNGVGFNGTDATLLSSFAKQIRAWEGTDPSQRRYRLPLSPKQMQLARRKMGKYAGQLARIAEENNQDENDSNPITRQETLEERAIRFENDWESRMEREAILDADKEAEVAELAWE
jgi:hypothetical protein